MGELTYNMGIVEDPRSPEEKAKDYKHEDTVGNVILKWVEKLPSEWKKFTPREQDGSLSCVAQAISKAMEITGADTDVFSAHPIYRARANYPGGGMYPQNACEIAKNLGTTIEEKDPSQNLGESKMNLECNATRDKKIENYFTLSNPKDIEKIAEAIELYGNCIFLVRCNKKEWIDVPKYLGYTADFGHEVCGLDYFIYNGKKCILIEDSTGHFNSWDRKGQRLLTEDFISKRVEDVKYIIYPGKYQFTQTMRLGSKGFEVKKLQEYLNNKLNLSLTTDGLFGKLTDLAVKKFQLKHNLAPDGIVGTKTRAELNK